MFSFRTTPLEDQLDKALLYGKVGCFCTQNCWDTGRGRWMYDIFRERGNLSVVFNPREAEWTPGTNHIEFDASALQDLDAVVVEIQDVGVRYFNYSKDVMALMEVLRLLGDDAPSLQGRFLPQVLPVDSRSGSQEGSDRRPRDLLGPCGTLPSRPGHGDLSSELFCRPCPSASWRL